MKASEKEEIPDDRVLSVDEWHQFAPHLTARAREICQVALGRFLRLSDIKKITKLAIAEGSIKGVQGKTGFAFKIPTIANQPQRYDFTNFRRDFKRAQITAGMNKPANHPLHFSPKDLRRTGATWAYRETRDLAGISRMLGHRSERTTRRYLHITDVDISAITTVIDRHLFRVA
jgi:integrase